MKYDNILVSIDQKVGLIQLNRPQALNALNDALMDELGQALITLDANPDVGCIVLTGSEKAFAAGADIAEMADKSTIDAYQENFITRNWETILQIRKPVIAAVSGFALGGGCELAMMCDTIYAADSAKFGQPEVKLAVLPGAGGTQRLPRAIGKAKAMDMCLTGRMLTATEAETAGLVARIFPADQLLGETLKIAQSIAALSLPAVMMVKQAVNRSFEGTLSEGLAFERQLFYSAFSSQDQKEGMKAFLEKRVAQFTNR